MRKLLLLCVVSVALTVVPGGVAASPTLRLLLVHAVSGCHMWGKASDSTLLGPNWTTTAKPGTRVTIRVNCPMGFQFEQLAGPKLAGLPATWQSGTSHTLVLAKRGLYRIKATNLQSSEQMGLQTLGADNTPVLTVRVR
jgi:hypothetical protein